MKLTVGGKEEAKDEIVSVVSLWTNSSIID